MKGRTRPPAMKGRTRPPAMKGRTRPPRWQSSNEGQEREQRSITAQVKQS